MLFIAMRYVAGGDVRDLLARERQIAAARVAAIVSAVASALDSAHAAGLVHRDVKPANILLDTRPGRPDHVYLSDFGLSKGAFAVPPVHTRSGQFVGTPDYTAPEQIQGHPVTGRTDQYGLACTAFELLSGEPVYPRDLGVSLIYAHLSEPLPSLGSRAPRPARRDRRRAGPGTGQDAGGPVRQLRGVRRGPAGGPGPARLRIRAGSGHAPAAIPASFSGASFPGRDHVRLSGSAPVASCSGHGHPGSPAANQEAALGPPSPAGSPAAVQAGAGTLPLVAKSAAAACSWRGWPPRRWWPPARVRSWWPALRGSGGGSRQPGRSGGSGHEVRSGDPGARRSGPRYSPPTRIWSLSPPAAAIWCVPSVPVTAG